MKRTACHRCGDPILWGRVMGGRRFVPLDPEILGDPKPNDFPLNIYFPDDGTVRLVTEDEGWEDAAEFHRHHGDTCKGAWQ